MFVRNLGHEADVATLPNKHPGLKPSCLVYNNTKVLIDITIDFAKQLDAGEVEELNGILITHCHQDAIGGIPKFNEGLKYLGKTVPLYALSKNINIIRHKYSERSLSQFEFKPFKNYTTFKLGDLQIKPLYVFHDKNFPTTAYNINAIFFYCADFGLPEGWEKDYEIGFFSNNLLAIIDGAYWDNQIPLNNHIAIIPHFNDVMKLNNRFTYLTGYGNQWGDLEEAQKILDKLLLKYKRDNPDTKVKAIKIVKDNQEFDLAELKKED